MLDIKKSCWCNDPTITFPEELLSQIPPELRRKACICKTCVLNFQASQKSQ
ncbi:cysteine-rich CWC family protein [Vibrio ziniensis]|uniref:cysteine-rich CWC family protein n=1 Tax=Vibrio ziniensis TaxID=2711221 RepID=UPI001FE2FF2D|nr:cysteine-rich CWC family protein [Vibrio ziniensis]